MYSNPFHYDLPYTGQSALLHGHCPICGSTGDCPDAVPVAMPYPPVDLDATRADDPVTTPLRSYAVTVYGYTTVMRLNDSDAARYGDAAVLIP